jgi:hypothetical protein
MDKDIGYIDDKWDSKRYGAVPKMRQLKFRSGRHTNTTWVETVHKTDEDRIWFYDEFVPFVRKVSDVVSVWISDNQVPSNDKIGWYLPDRLAVYIVEILIQLGVGFLFKDWDVRE